MAGGRDGATECEAVRQWLAGLGLGLGTYADALLRAGWDRPKVRRPRRVAADAAAVVACGATGHGRACARAGRRARAQGAARAGRRRPPAPRTHARTAMPADAAAAASPQAVLLMREEDLLKLAVPPGHAHLITMRVPSLLAGGAGGGVASAGGRKRARDFFHSPGE